MHDCGSWQALGSTVSLRLAAAHGALTPVSARAARESVARELAAIDLACSRFRCDSELSRVNARAGRATPAGPLLLEALELAVRAARLTDGDVDPTLGRALALAGYDRDWQLLPAPGAPSARRGRTRPAPTLT